MERAYSGFGSSQISHLLTCLDIYPLTYSQGTLMWLDEWTIGQTNKYSRQIAQNVMSLLTLSGGKGIKGQKFLHLI